MGGLMGRPWIETMVKGRRRISRRTESRRFIGLAVPSCRPRVILLKLLLFFVFRIVRVGLAYRHDCVVAFRVSVSQLFQVCSRCSVFHEPD